MSLATQEGLHASLVKALAWRKKEISQLRQAAGLADDHSTHLYRAGIVLLCAHWEGFVKIALDSYIDHVFAQGLRHPELKPCFVAVSYFADVKAAALTNFPGSEETHLKLARRIAQGASEECNLRSWWARTEGNPTSEVLRRLLSSAGLNERLNLGEAAWSTTKVFIDEQIVGDRNKIAHGEGLPIARAEFLERAKRLIALLDDVADLVSSSAKTKVYRRS